jgi:hypothetical protein
VAEQRGERHDGEHRQHEQQPVRPGREPLGGEDRRHEGEQPQQRSFADLA